MDERPPYRETFGVPEPLPNEVQRVARRADSLRALLGGGTMGGRSRVLQRWMEPFAALALAGMVMQFLPERVGLRAAILVVVALLLVLRGRFTAGAQRWHEHRTERLRQAGRRRLLGRRARHVPDNAISSARPHDDPERGLSRPD